METNSSEKPNCNKCLHYYITWEKSHPYGCKKWNFKSFTIPSVSVLRASGKECQLFESKKAETSHTK